MLKKYILNQIEVNDNNKCELSKNLHQEQTTTRIVALFTAKSRATKRNDSFYQLGLYPRAKHGV